MKCWFSILETDSSDVEQVVLGEQGVIQGPLRGSVVVDMETISPAAAHRVARALAQKDIEMLERMVKR